MKFIKRDVAERFIEIPGQLILGGFAPLPEIGLLKDLEPGQLPSSRFVNSSLKLCGESASFAVTFLERTLAQ